jgi:hypothetical protein
MLMRIQGELRTVEVRTHLIERLLPVPDQVIPVDKLVEFRRRHGNLLPGLYCNDAKKRRLT